MRLSKKTDYALRALFTLAEFHGGDPIPIRELARRNDVPKRFLEHIMLDLKTQGWVTSVAGKKGGYLLAKSPGSITMGQVIRLFDGVLAPIHCVSSSHYEHCNQEPVCRFRRQLLNVRNLIANAMDAATLQLVLRGAPVETHEVFDDRYVGGAGI